MEQRFVCGRCHRPVAPATRFCGRCGMRLYWSAPDTTPRSKRPAFSRILPGLMALVILAAAALFGWQLATIPGQAPTQSAPGFTTPVETPEVAAQDQASSVEVNRLETVANPQTPPPSATTSFTSEVPAFARPVFEPPTVPHRSHCGCNQHIFIQ